MALTFLSLGKNISLIPWQPTQPGGSERSVVYGDSRWKRTFCFFTRCCNMVVKKRQKCKIIAPPTKIAIKQKKKNFLTFRVWWTVLFDKKVKMVEKHSCWWGKLISGAGRQPREEDGKWLASTTSVSVSWLLIFTGMDADEITCGQRLGGLSPTEGRLLMPESRHKIVSQLVGQSWRGWPQNTAFLLVWI